MEIDESQALEASARLLDRQRIAVLSTSDLGHPHTTLIVFASGEDLRTLVFFVDREHQTYRNLKADGRVSLMIDSRIGADDVWNVEALRINGVAWELKVGPERDRLRGRYLEKNPDMASFAAEITTAMFKVTVDAARYIRNFSESFDVGI
ncbi:MAG: pyridoxamine 5'-phosphate oxidase family protein [Deltaproteobacteria bacterium]|nr:pyridoxamine 5'-phosphate oxidase family protein [Deltaproteobacteria bacterium]